MNMNNMMGAIPGMADTAQMSMDAQGQAQLQARGIQQPPSPFSPQALQTAQGVYGTGLQKDQSLMQGGTSAALI